MYVYMYEIIPGFFDDVNGLGTNLGDFVGSGFKGVQSLVGNTQSVRDFSHPSFKHF